MRDEPPETTELEAFVRVVETGSVSAAAAELGVPRATVGRRLARLEERLSVRLLRRTTRRIGLTDAGCELYRHARPIVHAVHAAAEAVRRDDDRPRGLLRVAAPPPHADPQFLELFLTFLEAYPEVELEVVVATRHEDLVASGIDVAIRAARAIDPGLVARRIGESELIAVASPAYLARVGRPARAEDLARHVCLLGHTGGERPETHWPRRGGEPIRVRGRVVSNDLGLLLAAALRGFGIALLPRMLCARALGDGELEVVLANEIGAVSQVALVYPDRKHLKPAVRAFVDHAVARLRSVVF